MFTTTLQRRGHRQSALVQPGLFVLGYLAIWTGFSLLATLAQWGLHAAALLSPEAVSTSPVLGSALLTAAGVYQWSPLKHACLRRCRSPLGFLMTEWREGPGGALIMGLRHGVFCVGCCWALMALLFITGVMNLLWIAAIAGFILIEKVIPAGEYVARLAGLLLIGFGILMVANSINA
jgi:predicted metal-binding membrane protein